MSHAMDARVLGHTFVERMTNSTKYAVMTIGNERFTRHQLVTEIGTGNFRAARILSDLCKTLRLSSVNDLYLISPYELASTHGIGVTTLYVLMALFESRGLSVPRWYGLNNGGAKSAVTFEGLKTRAMKRDRESDKREKRQAIADAHRAHEERTREFLEKHAT